MKRPWGRLATALLFSGVSAAAFAQSSGTLLQAVLVSRHGVRTPTMSNEVLANFAAQPWPAWKEPLGNLTAKGKRLATLVGRYQRSALAAEKLLPASGCPEPGSVYVYADVVERTEQTAEGFLEGLAPGCGIPIRSKAPAKIDGVFHPVAAGVCRIDALQAQSAILERVGGSFSSVLAAIARPSTRSSPSWAAARRASAPRSDTRPRAHCRQSRALWWAFPTVEEST